MSDRPPGPRKYLPIRVDTDEATRIEQLAAQETEGNVSMMCRRLLREALDHRDHAARPTPGATT